MLTILWCIVSNVHVLAICYNTLMLKTKPTKTEKSKTTKQDYMYLKEKNKFFKYDPLDYKWHIFLNYFFKELLHYKDAISYEKWKKIHVLYPKILRYWDWLKVKRKRQHFFLLSRGIHFSKFILPFLKSSHKTQI